MHRALILTFAILPLTIPVAAADEPPTFACHDWELFEGDRDGTAVGASPDDGALYLALRVEGVDTVYVVSDEAPGVGPSLFSVWIYTETNGEPGLQRHDEVCDDTNDGEREQDCFISCTF